MSINLIRTADGWHVLHGNALYRVPADLPTTAALVRQGLTAVRASVAGGPSAAGRPSAAGGPSGEPANDPAALSPITTPCRIVAQAVNYRSHARESGSLDNAPAVFFRESSASIAGPTDDVVRPGHVRLLDYEIELGLVMGQSLAIGTTVTDADLPHYVVGVVICDDITARDVQLEAGQFYESKSYPTFTPTGPRLVLLEPEEFSRIPDLRLQLWVNGEIRQDGTVADMITRPAAALTLLARFQRLDPGDLVLTGTPGGTALQAPPAIASRIGGLLPTRLKWQAFFSREERNPKYLKAGDVITASIATRDGTLDLGVQRTVVRDASVGGERA